MDIDDETAMWLWELRFAKKKEAQDRKGRMIMKETYRQGGSAYGWNIYYNIPKKTDSPCRLRDFEIVHKLTYTEKAQDEYWTGNR
jgi:hypothetical protein